jgi:hypothetical protein
LKYNAHSTGDESRADWQLLREHLNDTADRAEQFGQRLDAAPVLNLC